MNDTEGLQSKYDIAISYPACVINLDDGAKEEFGRWVSEMFTLCQAYGVAIAIEWDRNHPSINTDWAWEQFLKEQEIFRQRWGTGTFRDIGHQEVSI